MKLPVIILGVIAYLGIHYAKMNKDIDPDMLYAIDIVCWGLIIFAVLGSIRKYSGFTNSKMII